MSKQPPARNQTLFLVGIASAGLLIGILTGASPSPVAGTVIAAALGLMVAALTSSTTSLDVSKLAENLAPALRQSGDPEAAAATLQGALSELENREHRLARRAGALLIVAAIAVALGVLLGALLRLNDIPTAKRHESRLPWVGKEAPKMTYNAVDWMVVQHDLLARGYTHEQIELLYGIQLTEWKNSGGEREPQEGLVAKTRPLSSITAMPTESEPTKSGLITKEDTPSPPNS
ncbi:MAG TPA: hypothetical protein VGS57_22815 [Thermoanaerobaculia bacterium]|jgi:hypothetical protein|nr:hypothetical protein [Thermoanaerobaculia bacterium]